eukprot:6193162-Pleurochrysis_carterae.AAC.1
MVVHAAFANVLERFQSKKPPPPPLPKPDPPPCPSPSKKRALAEEKPSTEDNPPPPPPVVPTIALHARYMLADRAVFVWSSTESHVGIALDELKSSWASIATAEFESAAKPLDIYVDGAVHGVITQRLSAIRVPKIPAATLRDKVETDPALEWAAYLRYVPGLLGTNFAVASLTNKERL